MEITKLNDLSFPTNPSEFERVKPINTYKRICEMENKLIALKSKVVELEVHLSILKDGFLKGE
jgi:hypothetical protein